MIKKVLFILFLFTTLQSSAQFGIGSGTNTTSVSDDNGSLYWTLTGIISGGNIAANTFNIIRIKKGEKQQKYKSNAVFGIISGTLQTLVGAVSTHDYPAPAYINIGIGAATITTSIIRLAKKSPPKDPKLTYNFFYLPKFENTASVVGVHLVRRFN